MATIAIVGVGAIGGVIAALLQKSGRHDVIMCTRRQFKELLIETPDGDIRIQSAAVTDPSVVSPVDWVMIATKAYDVPTAAKWLERLCAGGAPVAVLQNGIEHRDRLAPYVPWQSILPVIVDCPAERRDSGRVIQRGAMYLKVQDGSMGRSFVELFSGTAVNAMVVSDFLSIAWRKLCHNSAGVLPALLLQPASVMGSEAIGDVVRQIVCECIAVGRVEGAILEDEIVESVLEAYRSVPGDTINSLHADRLAGRRMEIDARNGVIVRLGKKHGIPTPTNSMAVALLKTLVDAQMDARPQCKPEWH